MCGIAGAIHLAGHSVPALDHRLSVMGALIRHRGPDDDGTWSRADKRVGFAHRRLSIIDIEHGHQPMRDDQGNWIVFNGEIYNYRELRRELGEDRFRTNSDTEVILHAYREWGRACVDRLRGMFAFAIWDEAAGELFCARDRFGIKPFYWAVADDVLYFASEVKALLPFMDRIETDPLALKEYLTFQFCLDGKTLFAGVKELPAGHMMRVRGDKVWTERYWEVYYDLDFDHTGQYFEEQIRSLFAESVDIHLRADVPLGSYVSGGFDSSIVATLGSRHTSEPFLGFNGRFTEGPEFDESHHARAVADAAGFELHTLDITVDDFVEHIRRIIYHLDYPVAGPGSFPQFMISGLASQHRKVLLGGQGGDEIFGGYTRYLIAYFEQCIKAAIDGTSKDGSYIVTYESIIPGLESLRQYKPLLKHFWKDGLFESLDRRYFRLIDRAPSLGPEINWEMLGDYDPFETFRRIFRADNVQKESYFDSMTHFDFKTLLPALLHVEDRVSMAHGLESRVPLLDHPLVEVAATIPSNIKFKDGNMKHLLRQALGAQLPDQVVNRKDKMGFPVPLTDWVNGPARDFVRDVLSTQAARTRDFVDNETVLANLDSESRFGRKLWGLLSLELWQQEFHDKAHEYRGMLERQEISL
ncbi:MAG: asparagine synthase (glutamine-hydrolyzing) [Planctomycetes bacterium]|nr:asparagine synthase (glutamine-hydrolyzing) [Planctomycetota bacterium]